MPNEITNARGNLIIYRDASGAVVQVALGDAQLAGVRTIEQKAVLNSDKGSYLAVTLALECDSVTFVDIVTPDPEP